ncbi:E3 ubiquitin-protein ligase ATL41-like [Macadamia integrifolia]|uniref:E3 ubiquitin-protein ligase ATL41-like n=1 Tax=Macadamia integrifolia TaxID=60698 RepID=UPI001C4EFFC3|nr:E3 ubiquitin-protein ligase ATL41-like [Macadamia integrifolia]
MNQDHWDNQDPFEDTQERHKFNMDILLTAVSSLFVVIVLVLLLHIYVRYLLRRQRRRRTIIRLSVGTTSTEPPKRGLEPAAIAALPVFVYKGTGDQLEATNKTECTVCLSSIEDGEMARLLPNCKHMFHVECIDMWFSSHSTCPICRTGAEPQLQAQTLAHETGVTVPPTAPPLDSMLNSTILRPEGTSEGAAQTSKAVGSVSSRLSSFRRMLSKDRSERRSQASGQADGVEDLERQ